MEKGTKRAELINKTSTNTRSYSLIAVLSSSPQSGLSAGAACVLSSTHSAPAIT